MKNFKITLLYILLFFSFSLNMFPDDFKISLKENCENKKSCSNRDWYIQDSFEEKFLEENFIPDNTWKKVDSFPIWVNKFYTYKENLHIYSFLTEFELPENIILDKQTGIRFGEIGEAFEVYLNGKLIAKDGIFNEKKVILRRTVRGQVFEFDRNILKNKNKLLIKIIGDPKYDHTGFYLKNGYDIGYNSELKYEEQDRISLILIGIYLVVGIYHLFLFIKRKKEKSNLFYSLYIIALGIYLFTRNSAVFENHWDTGYIQKVELCFLYPMAACLFLLLEELFFQKVRKITIYLTAYSLILSILTIFVPLYFAEFILRLWQISFLFFGVGILSNILFLAIKNKVQNAKRLLFGIVMLVFSAVFDVLDSLIFNSGLAFTKYTFFIFVFGFATILANKFISVHNEIEDLNETLEKRVEERTRELTESLKKVNELKKQQDGDYYLTSLLIHPLGSNNSDKKNVSINFYVEQKKKFNFKGLDSEIGGDLCRTETITLKGKNFTVFFNSDAMGKSIQGAGGAIVMGAVFDSILERTLYNKNTNSLYPERWLKNSFVELHKVFESFDCSMLVSVVLGLIDDMTGLMYFIVAEHPSPVLYRDGKASFIETTRMYHKLGMPINDSDQVLIETFQMKFGDVVILGSDGRDDILVRNEKGEKELNIEEKLFLDFVEKGRGSILDITSEIKDKADLTDDLSLMSLYLTEDLINLGQYTYDDILNLKLNSLELNNKDFSIITEEEIEKFEFYDLKLYLLDLYKKKNFEKFVLYSKKFLENIPSDNYILYLLSFSYKELKRYTESIEIGERIRLRGVFPEKNTLNLIQSYQKLDNHERAKFLHNNLLKNYPENEIIKNLIID